MKEKNRMKNDPRKKRTREGFREKRGGAEKTGSRLFVRLLFFFVLDFLFQKIQGKKLLQANPFFP